MSLLQKNKSFTLIRTSLRENLVSAQQGFTLIEILIVLSIIGMLIAVTLFGVGGARESTRDAQRKSDIEAIRSALELYKSDLDYYPGNLAILEGANYISVPNDPITDWEYNYYPDPIAAIGQITTYDLCAALEGDNPGSASCGSNNCGTVGGTTISCNYGVTNP